MARFRIKEIILKNDLFVRAISILQIFLIISLTFVISLNFNSPNVYAAEETFGCCSKTKQDSDGNVNYCEITTRQACDGSWAATSCDQTAFCSLGVCANNDGYCYNNYPKALCESRDNSTHYRGKSINEINECKLGCCLIGTQAAYITRNKCITSTTEFASDLEVDFREDVNSEQECLNLAQNTEEGCCVTESSCSFGAKSTCNLPDAVNGTGFYKNTYCSQLSNSCDCAPANPTLDRRKGTGDLKSTMCLPDRDEVYWRDSCGNPEGIKENCNYNEGTLCGDSDGNGVFVCESLACLDEDGKKSQEDKFSFELSSYIGRGTDKGELTKDGVLNGESWCEYDSAYQEQNNANPSTAGRLGRDPPGSRYYRSLCINGQELVEPCKDFREEFCYKNTVPINTSEGDKDYTEARCIPNEWQVCVNECNTADSTTMDQATYQRALEKDAECCLNRPNRDCAWNGNKCVPAVAPGFKYWEGEGADICSRGSTTCSAVFVCKGWNAILGQCSEDVDKAARVGAQGGIGAGAGAIFAGVAAGGFVAAPVIIGGVLAFALIGGSAHFDDGWNIVSGAECLSVNYLQASNNLCRSMGDCGADFNYLHNYGGVDNNHSLSYNGFSMTPTLQESDDENLNQILAYLKSDAGVDGIEKALEISIKSDKEREEELKIDIPDRKEKIIVETKNSVPASFEGNKKNDKDDLVPVWGEPTIDKNEKSYEKDRTKVSGRDFYDYVGSKDERFGGFGRALIGDIENDDSFRAAYGFVFSPIGAGAISIVASLVGAAFAPAGITYGTAFSAGIATTPLGTGVNSLIGLGADAASAKVGELGLSGLRSATEKAAVDGARTGFTEAIAGRAAFTDVQKAALREVITEEFGEGAVESLADQAINAYSLPAGQSPAQLSFEFGGRELTEKQLIQKTSDKLGQKAVEQSSKAAGENLGFSSGASYLAGISGAMWAYTAYQIVDVIAEDTQTLTISTTCQPWQAPVYQYKENEDPCTKCNPDHKDYVDEQGNPDDVRAFKTCSEYRCKSLGASCNLINKGTTEETCVSLNKLDTASPKVSAWKEGFIIEGQNREKKIFKYETHVRETANTELKINYDIPIYKTFTIGLKTDEPSQCKMSFKHSRRYEEMENFYFGSNTHKYFHVQTMTYPNTKNATSDKNNKLTGGGNYTLYVRCIDAVGNANERDYVIELDVEKEPDVTPPTIVGSSITPPDEGLKLGTTNAKEVYLSANANYTNVDLFINEPADCRWSFDPRQYDQMNSTLQCSTGTRADSAPYYSCKFRGDILQPTPDPSNGGKVGPAPNGFQTGAGAAKFIHFKCQDHDEKKNFNKDAYTIVVRGSEPLNITKVKPSGLIKTSAALVNVTLEAETTGGAFLNGNSICKYVLADPSSGAVSPQNFNGMEQFSETNSSVHRQAWQPGSGNHKFYIGCYDIAGNTAFSEINFVIEKDVSAPRIIKVYKDPKFSPPQFTIELDEAGECKDSIESSNFDYETEGNLMLATDSSNKIFASTNTDSDVYYVKCKDNFGNLMEQTAVIQISGI